MSTFTWPPSYNSSITEQPAVNSATFGDGYSQDVADGINNLKKMWSLQFNNIKPTDAVNIRAFLKALGGTTAFDWTDPDGETGRYLCRAWPRSFPTGALQNFTLTFEQVFGR